MAQMKFRSSWKGFVLNTRAFLGSTDAKMRLATEEAARIWLRHAIPAVPVWSGASRATFEQLASAVGVNVPITVAPKAPNRVALGRANSRGGIEKGKGKANWRFYYENNLRYLAANETRSVGVGEAGVKWGLIQPTPYNFREAAQAAVDAFAKTVRLPRIEITSK